MRFLKASLALLGFLVLLFLWAPPTGAQVTRGSASRVLLTAGTFATLGSPANGTLTYCSDCVIGATTTTTCAGSGTGALAKRLNGVWVC